MIGKQGRLLSESNLQVTASQINSTVAENFLLKRLIRILTLTYRTAIVAILFPIGSNGSDSSGLLRSGKRGNGCRAAIRVA